MIKDQGSSDPVFVLNQMAYKSMGFGAQRRYPNEELCRFIGRNYFSVPTDKCCEIKILELGTGTASNLWMIAKEGFDAYGIDLASSAIPLARNMLDGYDVKAAVQTADMTQLPFPGRHFDCVLDVFSAYSLDEIGFQRAVAEVARVLKPQGRFFVYTPGKKSDAFLNFRPAERIDGSTLNGIYRETSAYFGNNHPFRFVTHAELASILAAQASSKNLRTPRLWSLHPNLEGELALGAGVQNHRGTCAPSSSHSPGATMKLGSSRGIDTKRPRGFREEQTMQVSRQPHIPKTQLHPFVPMC
jgi:SAM-dependent methyltransferase